MPSTSASSVFSTKSGNTPRSSSSQRSSTESTPLLSELSLSPDNEPLLSKKDSSMVSQTFGSTEEVGGLKGHYEPSLENSRDGTSTPASYPPEPHCNSSTMRRRNTNRSTFMKPSLTLVNSGSVARDHLSSERTFLAYVRTSLTIASTGVALVQLFTISANTNPNSSRLTSQRLQVYARPLGAAIVFLGMAVLATGVTRYFSVQSALTKGKFPVARVTVAAITTGLSVLVILVFSVLVAVKRS